MDGLALTNKNEELLVTEINNQINERMLKSEKFTTSATFVPQYDSVLSENDKKEIIDCPLSPRVESKVKTHQARVNFK